VPAQLIQTGIGARGQIDQAAAEVIDALALAQRDAVELGAQFAATGALFVAQRFFDLAA
jgi:hypothetical protein